MTKKTEVPMCDRGIARFRKNSLARLSIEEGGRAGRLFTDAGI